MRSKNLYVIFRTSLCKIVYYTQLKLPGHCIFVRFVIYWLAGMAKENMRCVEVFSTCILERVGWVGNCFSREYLIFFGSPYFQLVLRPAFYWEVNLFQCLNNPIYHGQEEGQILSGIFGSFITIGGLKYGN